VNSGIWVVLAVLTLFLTVSAPVFGQVPTGSIGGTVKDVQGLPVSGAKVVVTNQGTDAEYKATTSDLGSFQIIRLDFGMYKVTVTKQGFRTGSVTDIKLDAGTQYSLPPIILEVGSVSETVVVEAGAQMVQTTNSQVTGTVEKKQIQDLPLNSRSPLNLVGLQPGTNTVGKTSSVINGQRTSFTNVTMDGINIQDNFIRSNDLDFLPNLLLISQVAEFTITTQNAGPEAGLGSSQVSFVTPSGTNSWHGEGFWYHRNSALGANSWFNNAQGVPRGQLIQNQGGGNMGGPIFKNKLFIYGYWEAFRRKQTSAQNHTVLTSAARNGLFTFVPTCTVATCPIGVTAGVAQQVKLVGTGGLRPSLVVDPVINSLIGKVPTTINNFSVGDSLDANTIRNTAGFTFNKRNNRTRDNVGTRVDFVPSSKHTFSGIWQWNRDLLDRPDLDGTYGLVPVVTNSDYVKFLSTSWRWNIKPNLTNEVRYGFNLAPAIFDTTQQFGNFIIAAPTSTTGLVFTNPDTTFRAQGRYTNTYALQDNGGYTRGNHVIVFGAQWQKIHVKQYNDAGITPTFTVNSAGLGNSSAPGGGGLVTSDFTAFGGISSANLGTANALLATLAGAISQNSQTFNVTSRTSGFVPKANTTRNNSLNDLSFYGGDSWRLRKNLTVNYGLRWEYIGRFDEDNGLTLLPVIQSGQTALQTLLSNATVDFAGSGTPRPLYNRDLNNFAPNIGIAWDPRGNGKMAIRAGYSWHFANDEAIRAADNAQANNAGLSSTGTKTGLVSSISGISAINLLTPTPVPTPAFAVPTTFQNNFTNLGTPQAGFLIDPNIATPYVQEWNLSVQRDIGWNTSLTVSYIGNKGTGLYQVIDYNQVLINQNGVLADFLRARSNGFLAAATPASTPGCALPSPFAVNSCATFNPYFNPAVAGSQPLTVLTNLCGQSAALPGATFTSPPCPAGVTTQLLNASVPAGNLQSGSVGEFVNNYFTTNRSGTVQLMPNQLTSVADILQAYSSSSYHSGAVELRRRFSRGLYFQVSYVYSKVLTNSSGTGQTKVDPLMDNAQPGIERERADFDVTHAFKANYVYELPFGTGHRLNPSNKVLNQIVSGWNTTSVFTWQTGSPYSILSNRGTLNRAGRSSGKNGAVTTLDHSQISNLLGVFFQGSKVLAINPQFIGSDGRGVPADTLAACAPLVTGGFCNPVAGTVGILQRNAFNAPVFFNWDFSAFKQFKIRESLKLEYRAEMFNAINHPIFFIDNQDINSTSFGRITQTISSARVVQMALRLIF
jgi:hypothetical protein